MTLTSVEMLRRHNKTLPVRVFLVRDHTRQTIVRENVSIYNQVSEEAVDDFLSGCEKLGVEVRERIPLIFEGEETFFHINRKYLAELKEENVLYIDADTFIFGDVANILENHAYVDFAACEASWARAKGWDPRFLQIPTGPFSSGLMVWNNGSVRDWCDLMPRYFSDFRKNDTALANWLHSLHEDCLLREEFSVTLHVSLSGLTHSFIEESDCHLIREEACIDRLGESTIFHCYTPNWKKCYQKLWGKKHAKVAFGKVNRKPVPPFRP